MPNILIKDENGVQQTYNGVEEVQFDTVGGGVATYTSGGGGSIPESDWSKCQVEYYDWDGTLLRREWVTSGTVVDPPNGHPKSDMVFKEWVGNVDITDPIFLPYNAFARVYEFDYDVEQNETGDATVIEGTVNSSRQIAFYLYAEAGTTLEVDCGEGETPVVMSWSTAENQLFVKTMPSTATAETKTVTITQTAGSTYKLGYYVTDAQISSRRDGFPSSYGFSVTSCTLAEGVGLCPSVFNGMTAMSEVDLPYDLEVIPMYAFYNTNLESIELPTNLTTIKQYAFYNSSHRTEATRCVMTGDLIIPIGCTLIEQNNFEYTLFDTIKIPKNCNWQGAYHNGLHCKELYADGIVSLNGFICEITDRVIYGFNYNSTTDGSASAFYFSYAGIADGFPQFDTVILPSGCTRGVIGIPSQLMLKCLFLPRNHAGTLNVSAQQKMLFVNNPSSISISTPYVLVVSEDCTLASTRFSLNTGIAYVYIYNETVYTSLYLSSNSFKELHCKASMLSAYQAQYPSYTSKIIGDL